MTTWSVHLTYSRPRGRDTASLVEGLLRHLEPYEAVMSLAPDRISVAMTVYDRIDPAAALICALDAVDEAPDGLPATRVLRAEVMTAAEHDAMLDRLQK